MTGKPTKRTGRRATSRIPVVLGSGNVFADMGLPDAEVLQAKAAMAIHIWTVISARGLTQRQAARILGIDQPGVSDIVRGHLRRYSSDSLIRFLSALGQDVELVITDRGLNSRRPGRLRVRNGNARSTAAASRLRP
jgi:predicted XRE-type DNA-binding protein